MMGDVELFVPSWKVRLYDSLGKEKRLLSPLLDVISFKVDNSTEPETDMFTVGLNNKDGKHTSTVAVGDIVKINTGYNPSALTTRIHGVVDDITFKIDSSGEVLSFKGKDYSSLFLRKIISQRYDDKDVNKIITAISSVDGYSGIIELGGLRNDITWDNVDATTYNITINFKNKTVLDCLKELAEIMMSKGDGEKWAFYLDIDKDLHFYQVSTAPTSSDTLVVGENVLACSITPNDISRIANKIKVQGAYETAHKVDEFNVGEGSTQYSFILTYSDVQEIYYLTIEGVKKEEGIDYKVNYLGGLISIDAGVVGAKTVLVSYLYKDRMETTGEWEEDTDSQATHGIKEWVVSLDIDNQTLIDNLTTTLLRYYKDPVKKGTARTWGLANTYAGNLITVTYAKAGINADTYKVVRLTHEFSTATGYVSNVTLEELIPDISDILKELLRGQSTLSTRMP